MHFSIWLSPLIANWLNYNHIILVMRWKVRGNSNFACNSLIRTCTRSRNLSTCRTFIKKPIVHEKYSAAVIHLQQQGKTSKIVAVNIGEAVAVVEHRLVDIHGKNGNSKSLWDCEMCCVGYQWWYNTAPEGLASMVEFCVFSPMHIQDTHWPSETWKTFWKDRIYWKMPEWLN